MEVAVVTTLGAWSASSGGGGAGAVGSDQAA